jgi:perosamine synthetase
MPISNLNAALGCAQLEQLPDFLKTKRQLANRYRIALRDIVGVTFVTEPENAVSNYWLNALLLDREHAGERNRLLELFNGRGVQARPAWTLLHRLPMYRDCPRMDLTTAEDIAARLINIPSSVSLALHDENPERQDQQ